MKIDVTNGLDFELKPTHYFKFGDFDSRDYNMFLGARETPTPERQGKPLYVPGRSGSVNRPTNPRKLHYNDRPVKYPFTIFNYDEEDIEIVLMEIENKLMAQASQRLQDAWDGEGWYFQGICVDVKREDDISHGKIDGSVEFSTYPLKRAVMAEGHDIWDEIRFNADLMQEVDFHLPTLTSQLPFKQLQIGDMITIGGWARFKATGGGHFSGWETESFYNVIDIRDREDTNIDNGVYSGIQYQIDDGSWIRAQDIVQARNGYAEGILYNTGSQAVLPTIKAVNHSGPAHLGYTIEKDGQFYNIRYDQGYEPNEKFALDIGANPIKIYGQGVNLSFIWHKEVI